MGDLLIYDLILDYGDRCRLLDERTTGKKRKKIGRVEEGRTCVTSSAMFTASSASSVKFTETAFAAMAAQELFLLGILNEKLLRVVRR